MKQKSIANRTLKKDLCNQYEQTERSLKKASKSGSLKRISKAMSKHHDIEYAMLYQDYAKAKKKKYKKRG